MASRPSILWLGSVVLLASFWHQAIEKSVAIGQIVPTGATQIQQSSGQFNIQGGNLSGDGKNLFHHFKQFNLTQDQIANFQSNPAIRNIITRISGGEASLINGLLRISGGNSNLYLINPSGILFGKDVRLDLPAAFNASTATEVRFGSGILGTTDYQTLLGDPTSFKFTALKSGAIVNSGNLTVGTGQSLSLLGSSVVNTGNLTALGGQITIAAIPNTNLVNLSHQNNVLSLEFQPFENQTTQSSDLPRLLAGRNIQNAQAIELSSDGQIKLTGSGLTLPNQTGVAVIAGSVDVSSDRSGGQVNILGNQVALANTTINASGNNQGGTVLVGGDFQGKGALPNAHQTLVNQGSTIDISANQQGNAGKAIIWADQSTAFSGFVRGEGGIKGGDGGFVEVSGKENLAFRGQVKLGVTQGKIGQLLLDPEDITIFAGGPQPGFNLPSFNAISGAASISTADLETLTTQSDIILNATRSIQADNIPKLGPYELTLQAPTLQLNDISAITPSAGGLKLIGNIIQTGDIDVKSVTINGNPGITGNQVTTGAILGNGIKVEAQGNIQHKSLYLRDLGGEVKIVSLSGNVSTHGIFSQGAPITIEANQGNIKTGLLFSTPNSNSPSGNITLSSGGNIETDNIDADGFWNGSFVSPAGAISLTAGINRQTGLQGNITTGGIRARGTYIGTEQINIDGNQVIIGKGDSIYNPTNDRAEDSVNLWSTGQVNIWHSGGQNNESLVIAAASPYDTLAAPDNKVMNIYFGDRTDYLSSLNAPNTVIIENRNTSPVIAAPTISTGILNAGESRTFTLRSLGVNSADAEKDTTRFFIRINTDNPNGKLYLKSTGEQFNQSLITVSLDDELIYQAPSNQPIQGKFLDVLASDLNVGYGALENLRESTIWFEATEMAPNSIVALSAASTPINTPPITPPIIDPPIQHPFQPPFIRPPVTEPIIIDPPTNIPRDLPNHPTPNPQDIPIARFNPDSPQGKTVDTEKKFIKDFSQLFETDKFVEKSINELPAAIDRITGATGVKPAVLYLNFAPATAQSATAPVFNQENDILELTLITAKGIQRKRINTGNRSEILQTAQTFRREVTNPIKTHTTSYLASAQQLYQWMIKPIEEILTAEKINNITFLADAGLRSIPYAALHDGQGFLIDRYSIGMMPSISLTDLTYRDIRKDSLLVLGISEATQGQTALPNVTTEVKALQTLWPNHSTLQNQDATLSTFSSARTQKGFNILHLATHGNFASGHKDQAYIQLWNDRLKLEHIRNLGWNNPPIELLVLSACKTAVGDRESELGFAGIAAQTGVKSTIASLWSVNDTATTALMSKLYESLKQSPIKAEALRQAQLSLAKGNLKITDRNLTGLTNTTTFSLDNTSSDTNFKHPYYWAAFTLIGNPW